MQCAARLPFEVRRFESAFFVKKYPIRPPDVDFSTLEENENATTARERLDAHNSNPSCAGCHLITDPMGLTLENFDGAGIFRGIENGATLDISGELDGIFYDDVERLSHCNAKSP